MNFLIPSPDHGIRKSHTEMRVRFEASQEIPVIIIKKDLFNIRMDDLFPLPIHIYSVSPDMFSRSLPAPTNTGDKIQHG